MKIGLSCPCKEFIYLSNKNLSNKSTQREHNSHQRVRAKVKATPFCSSRCFKQTMLASILVFHRKLASWSWFSLEIFVSKKKCDGWSVRCSSFRHCHLAFYFSPVIIQNKTFWQVFLSRSSKKIHIFTEFIYFNYLLMMSPWTRRNHDEHSLNNILMFSEFSNQGSLENLLPMSFELIKP